MVSNVQTELIKDFYWFWQKVSSGVSDCILALLIEYQEENSIN